MKRIVLLAVLAGLGAAAGCIGEAPDGEPADSAAADEPAAKQTVGDLNVLAQRELSVPSHPGYDQTGAHEPSVDVGPEGTIYVTAAGLRPSQRPSPLWFSPDGGETFAWVPWADAGSGLSDLPAGTEGDVGVDAAGNAYRVDTINGGTAVARSTDSGRTWELRNPQTFLAPGGDRPWVEGGGEDVVVVAWDQIFVDGLQRPVVAVSTDGGRTFPVQAVLDPCAAFPEAVGPGPAATGYPLYQNGDVAVAPDGTIYLSVNCLGHGVEVHRSTDGGETFEAFAAHESEQVPGDFTPVAVDEAGNVYVTWPENRNGTSHVYYAASRDEGETWDPPVRASHHGGASMMPWIEAGEAGHLAVAYYGAPGYPGAPHEADENASWHPFGTEVRHATGPDPTLLQTQMTDEVLAEGPECGASQDCPGAASHLWDYLGTDLGPEGRVHVVWAKWYDDRNLQKVSWGVAEASEGVAS